MRACQQPPECGHEAITLRHKSGATIAGMRDEMHGAEPRLIAIFANDGAAMEAARRAGIRLLSLAAPGVALLAADAAAAPRLYAAGARLVIT